MLQFMLTYTTYYTDDRRNHPKIIASACMLLCYLWLFKCTYSVITRIYSYCLTYSKDQCWHNVDQHYSVILLAGTTSCLCTYAEGNHPAFPLYSPSDHPFGATWKCNNQKEIKNATQISELRCKS